MIDRVFGAPTVESQKQLDVVLKCQFFKIFKIRVIFEILLNSIVCFFQFSSGYIRVRVVIKVDLFSGFYGIFKYRRFEILRLGPFSTL